MGRKLKKTQWMIKIEEEHSKIKCFRCLDRGWLQESRDYLPKTCMSCYKNRGKSCQNSK